MKPSFIILKENGQHIKGDLKQSMLGFDSFHFLKASRFKKAMGYETPSLQTVDKLDENELPRKC
ncbi:hypothetical protein [Peribacillus simplex]|uniref:hypothetical protein n=1 Tax=Peribacillus simplex TaxID=1478 RepID=UPI0024E1B271|nr:hypothetical protein [Peribacillus simplex]